MHALNSARYQEYYLMTSNVNAMPLPCSTTLMSKYLTLLITYSGKTQLLTGFYKELNTTLKQIIAKKNIRLVHDLEPLSDPVFREVLEELHNRIPAPVSHALNDAGFALVSRYSLYSSERARGKVCALLEWSEQQLQLRAPVELLRRNGELFGDDHVVGQKGSPHQVAALATVAEFFGLDLPQELLCADLGEEATEFSAREEVAASHCANDFVELANRFGLPNPEFVRCQDAETYKACLHQALARNLPVVAPFLLDASDCLCGRMQLPQFLDPQGFGPYHISLRFAPRVNENCGQPVVDPLTMATMAAPICSLFQRADPIKILDEVLSLDYSSVQKKSWTKSKLNADVSKQLQHKIQAVNSFKEFIFRMVRQSIEQENPAWLKALTPAEIGKLLTQEWMYSCVVVKSDPDSDTVVIAHSGQLHKCNVAALYDSSQLLARDLSGGLLIFSQPALESVNLETFPYCSE